MHAETRYCETCRQARRNNNVSLITTSPQELLQLPNRCCCQLSLKPSVYGDSDHGRVSYTRGHSFPGVGFNLRVYRVSIECLKTTRCVGRDVGAVEDFA